ncbi:sporulation integral membrane protein YtvI [Salipaludibacillus sp. CUR1]|uniref:sporulation integral membrane protein YtvI n=1 Tax=Salipaludibacillus sp. CUR1 TaxID=2820003 RepID=UPI001E5699AC|nr:sporulation integral membrane protein YtvI [Salipaludibacillus sp. CUR1]MCE7793369.1 sporulation integral membrane protein YtvI [Salipaludibacillus sp. CUR1]
MNNDISLKVWKRLFLLLILFTLFIILAYISVVYFYPFILAVLFSFMFLPFVNYLENRWRWNRSAATFTVISMFILLLMTLITFLVAELIHGLSYLTTVLPGYVEEIIHTFHGWINQYVFPLISEITRFTSKLGNESAVAVDQSFEQLLTEAGNQVGTILQLILNQLRDILVAFPHALTMILFSLLASFFITKDWPKLVMGITNHVPQHVIHFIVRIKEEWKSALGNYLMAQLTLVVITGVIVFAGLLILKVDYAFTAALLIAAVDILPYAGTGLVFLPWIIYSFLNEVWHMTIGLSVLYGVVVLQRQISEPKIVSHHMGVPALVMLFTIFACYQIFGFGGVLIGPFILIFIQSLNRANIAGEIKTFIEK